MALVDLSFEGTRYSGVDVYNESKSMHRDVPVVILSGYGGIGWADVSYNKIQPLDLLVDAIKSHLQASQISAK